MIRNETKIRVRYGETDQMGYVYYGNYAQFFEVGRVEWLRSMGVSYKSLEASGIMLPVTELRITYAKPARYDDELTVITTLSKKPLVKIEFDFRDDGVEITTQVKCTGKTGVEMEALTAVAVAALTIYDMCKAVERSVRIENIRLVSKSGGKSGKIVLE